MDTIKVLAARDAQANRWAVEAAEGLGLPGLARIYGQAGLGRLTVCTVGQLTDLPTALVLLAAERMPGLMLILDPNGIGPVAWPKLETATGFPGDWLIVTPDADDSTVEAIVGRAKVGPAILIIASPATVMAWARAVPSGRGALFVNGGRLRLVGRRTK